MKRGGRGFSPAAGPSPRSRRCAGAAEPRLAVPGPAREGRSGAAAGIAGRVLLFAILFAIEGTARAGIELNPFRTAAAPAARVKLDPFRAVADSATPPAGGAATTPGPPAPAAKSCQRDEDCGGENICQANLCQAIQVRTNVLYLYYREGSFREALLLYWSRRGPSGYTVVAPVYWHYWSPTSHARVIAPFFWRFEDHLRQSTLTVVVPILPVAWSHQPGARSFAVWPLFYASSKFGWAAPFLGTFKLQDPDAHRSFGAVGYLYWWWRTPARATDLGFPLFFSTRTESHAFTYALPLTVYWRRGGDANTLAVPFFYANTHPTGSWFLWWLGYEHREGTEYSGSLGWLFYLGDDPRAHASYRVFFPLVWHFENKGDAATVVFPLLWSFSGPTSNTTVIGPVVHVGEGSWYFNTAFGLGWSWGDRQTGRAHRLFVPFFYWDRAEHGLATRLVTPLGGYSRDDRAGTKTWGILPLLSFAHRDRGGERRMITPLYLSHQDQAADAMTRLVGLLFYRRTDSEGSSTALFPLFWYFHDIATGATATAFLPFFAHRSGPHDSTTIAGPFYWRRFTNGGWGGGLWPIAFFGDNAGRSHAVVFPLFWRFAGARSSTTVLLPVFYWHRDPRGYDSFWPPLLFVGNHDGESYAIQFPLLFHVASAREGSSTTVTPLGYAHRDRDGWSFGVGPIVPLLYARSGRTLSHFALVPLIWHFEDRGADRSTTVVGPFWHRRWGGETTDALFPLIHYRRGARPGGGDETSFTLFPLVHYRRDTTTRVLVTPLGAAARGPTRDAGFVGPYFWYDDKDLSVAFIPLLHADITRRSDGQRLRQWGPWFQVDGPGYRSRGIFPLFGHYADARESDTWVAPTFFRLRRSNGDQVDTLFPLFWRSSFAGRVTTVVGPFFDRRTPDSDTTGVVPLFFHARNAERTLTAVPPLLLYHWRASSGAYEWFSCALFFHSRGPDGGSTGFFPLYWSTTHGDRRHDIFFPIFWHFADRRAGSDWTLLGPFYSSTSGSRQTRGLLPVAWYTRDRGNGDASQAVVPFFYEGSGGDHFSFYTLLGGYHRRGPAHFWYAGLFLHTDGVQTRFSALFPLWFSHTDKATETTTTVIPPLLHVSRGNPESGFSSTLALFWHYRDIGTSTWLGLPLYFDLHEYHLSRTTVFLPLIFRYENEVEHDTTWVAPLFYRHSTPTDVSMVAFPLVWDFKRDRDRTTLVFPFYAHWRRADHASTYVFPSYYYREGLAANGNPDGTYRRFVLPFYDSGVKRPGDFMWEVFGGLFGHERIGTHDFLRLFYLTFETSQSSRAQTAWYSQPVSQPRKSVRRGLNVAGW
jgi:hypothetical protein